MKYRLSQKGDTLVEVLIAVVIVSSVLVGAFAVTQKNSASVRDSQERGEALQILQGQVEQVRSAALKATSTSDPIFSTTPKYFCMDTATNQRVNSPGLATLPANSSDNYANYAAACKNLGEARLYNVAISYDASSGVFNFVSRWDSATTGKDQVQLSYRISPGQTTYTTARPLSAAVRVASFTY